MRKGPKLELGREQTALGGALPDRERPSLAHRANGRGLLRVERQLSLIREFRGSSPSVPLLPVLRARPRRRYAIPRADVGDRRVAGGGRLPGPPIILYEHISSIDERRPPYSSAGLHFEKVSVPQLSLRVCAHSCAAALTAHRSLTVAQMSDGH